MPTSTTTKAQPQLAYLIDPRMFKTILNAVTRILEMCSLNFSALLRLSRYDCTNDTEKRLLTTERNACYRYRNITVTLT